MEFFFKQLAAVEQEIRDLIDRKYALRKKELLGTITDLEAIDLGGIDKLLEKLEQQQKNYFDLIKLSMRNDHPETKSFSEADRLWTQDVTGVDTSYRKWTDYKIDDQIQPSPGFQTAFENIGKTFHQLHESGRRIYLNLFLSDIILRPEFDETLRIYPELEVSVTQMVGTKKQRLNGRMDYAVGVGKGIDMFHMAFPKEVQLVAVQAKTDFWDSSLCNCVAQAAALYKTRVDADKDKKSVWGILSNAERWEFIFIDERGLLWETNSLSLNLRSFDESEVLMVYRMVYYIVKCCHEACTPLPSTTCS
jgi:hypothetical protein